MTFIYHHIECLISSAKSASYCPFYIFRFIVTESLQYSSGNIISAKTNSLNKTNKTFCDIINLISLKDTREGKKPKNQIFTYLNKTQEGFGILNISAKTCAPSPLKICSFKNTLMKTINQSIKTIVDVKTECLVEG